DNLRLRAWAGEWEIDFKPKPILHSADIVRQSRKCSITSTANSCRGHSPQLFTAILRRCSLRYPRILSNDSPKLTKRSSELFPRQIASRGNALLSSADCAMNQAGFIVVGDQLRAKLVQLF